MEQSNTTNNTSANQNNTNGDMKIELTETV
jgi:hypothetical protein